jgi:hypothetical protein
MAGAIMDNPITANNTATSATTHFITNKTHLAKCLTQTISGLTGGKNGNHDIKQIAVRISSTLMNQDDRLSKAEAVKPRRLC